MSSPSTSNVDASSTSTPSITKPTGTTGIVGTASKSSSSPPVLTMSVEGGGDGVMKASSVSPTGRGFALLEKEKEVISMRAQLDQMNALLETQRLEMRRLSDANILEKKQKESATKALVKTKKAVVVATTEASRRRAFASRGALPSPDVHTGVKSSLQGVSSDSPLVIDLGKVSPHRLRSGDKVPGVSPQILASISPSTVVISGTSKHKISSVNASTDGHHASGNGSLLASANVGLSVSDNDLLPLSGDEDFDRAMNDLLDSGHTSQEQNFIESSKSAVSRSTISGNKVATNIPSLSSGPADSIDRLASVLASHLSSSAKKKRKFSKGNDSDDLDDDTSIATAANALRILFTTVDRHHGDGHNQLEAHYQRQVLNQGTLAV